MFQPPMLDPIPARASDGEEATMDVVETRLWLDEHDRLLELLRSAQNTAPAFRMPDLVSACVASVVANGDAPVLIFGFMGTQLALRERATRRRRAYIWRPQFKVLHRLQCLPQNRHPHPSFQLDQFTTACAALCRIDDDSGAGLLHQARHNMANRLLAHPNRRRSTPARRRAQPRRRRCGGRPPATRPGTPPGTPPTTSRSATTMTAKAHGPHRTTCLWAGRSSISWSDAMRAVLSLILGCSTSCAMAAPCWETAGERHGIAPALLYAVARELVRQHAVVREADQEWMRVGLGLPSGGRV